MRSRTKTILFVLTLILVLLPALQQLTKAVPCKPLGGVTEEQSKPELTLQSFRDGSFQKDNEAYLKQHYGFREPLTRVYNQTLWSLFRYSKVEEDGRIVITPDNWLFEPWTVKEYYQSCSNIYSEDSLEVAKVFEAEAQNVLKVQKFLEQYNTHLFVALLPGKEQICAEHMPENTLYHQEKKITAYDFYSKRLKELGVNYVDFADWFIQMKDTVSYPLFPQTGTHWSVLAAQHAADSLVRYMEDLADINMVNIKLEPDFQRTLTADMDLESLMNLIWPLQKRPNRLAYAYPDLDSTAVKPTLITIGDSFYWNILNLTPVWAVFEKVPYWYYFSTAFYGTDDPTFTQKISDVDVLQEVIDADFVMLSYSTVGLYRLGNGFPERLLEELGHDENNNNATP